MTFVFVYSGGISTYRELCSIANDLNQPDLIYKFMHLANHNAMWNSRKVARAFEFYNIIRLIHVCVNMQLTGMSLTYMLVFQNEPPEYFCLLKN